MDLLKNECPTDWTVVTAQSSGLGTCPKIAVVLAILCVVFKCCIRQTRIYNDKTTCKVINTVSELKILLVRRAREVLYDDQ